MEIVFSDEARDDLRRMDRKLAEFFAKHVEKVARIPPRRHMKLGVPYNVETTEQARMTYRILEDGKLFISRCFATHKEYEAWYMSLR